MPTPVPSAYSRLQIRLHWLVFGLLALQYILHEPITEAFDRLEEGLIPDFIRWSRRMSLAASCSS